MKFSIIFYAGFSDKLKTETHWAVKRKQNFPNGWMNPTVKTFSVGFIHPLGNKSF